MLTIKKGKSLRSGKKFSLTRRLYCYIAFWGSYNDLVYAHPMWYVIRFARTITMLTISANIKHTKKITNMNKSVVSIYPMATIW